jgi:energy-coupling factor transport system permease protein
LAGRVVISADFYIDRQSWLHVSDPRVKFLLVLAASAITLVIKNTFLMAVVLAAAILIHRSARIPLDRIALPIKALLPISGLMVVIWVLFYPAGDALFSLGPVRFTPLSLANGLTVALRINAITLFVFAWLYTTTHERSVQALVKLKVPFAWGLTLLLAMRYIPSFQRTYAVIVDAQRSRGLSFESARGFKRVRLLMPVVVALVISSFRSSERLSIALEARGFGWDHSSRTSLRDIQMRSQDLITALVILVLAAAIFFLHLAFGFGADTILLVK